MFPAAPVLCVGDFKLTLALSGSNLHFKCSHSHVEIGFPLTDPIMGVLM